MASGKSIEAGKSLARFAGWNGLRPDKLSVLIVTQSLYLLSGCGSNAGPSIPGAVSSVLPGAEIVTQATFNAYLNSGQLAPYRSDISSSGNTGGGALELEAAGRMGEDLMLVSDYAVSRPEIHFNSQAFNHPTSTLEVTDSSGKVKKIQVSNNAYRIASIASGLRRQLAQPPLQGEESQNSAKNTSLKPPGAFQLASNLVQRFSKTSLKPLLKRGLASITEVFTPSNSGQSASPDSNPSPTAPSSSLPGPSPLATPASDSQTTGLSLLPSTSVPAIRCSASEVGHGLGLDDGSIGGIPQPYRVFMDGLISNFDYPLKNLTSCVKDQGIRGSCTAFAVIGALEILIAQKYGASVNLSEQALYFRGKGFLDLYSPDLDGFPVELFFEDFEKNKNYRVSYEKYWDYNISLGRLSGADFSNSCGYGYSEYCSNSPEQGNLLCSAPSGGPIQCGYLSQPGTSGSVTTSGGSVARFSSFLDLAHPQASLQKAIQYLQQGIPVVTEITLTNVFYSPYHGYVAEPTSTDQTVGGHSILLVGYVSEAQMQSLLPAREVRGNGGYFIVKNSWGPGMGDAGYFYISLNYLAKYAYTLIAVEDVNYTP